MGDWVVFEKTVRRRYCRICDKLIRPNTEVIKIYHVSFHCSCLLDQLIESAGKERSKQLLSDYVAEKV